mmetsp:Transcript_8906/g.25650  ORF Transcript_8906/g.25650 Transcript_8906/m.25650 type:complete len:275 (+) Transcript_8906:2603-3427(+)
MSQARHAAVPRRAQVVEAVRPDQIVRRDRVVDLDPDVEPPGRGVRRPRARVADDPFIAAAVDGAGALDDVAGHPAIIVVADHDLVLPTKKLGREARAVDVQTRAAVRAAPIRRDAVDLARHLGLLDEGVLEVQHVLEAAVFMRRLFIILEAAAAGARRPDRRDDLRRGHAGGVVRAPSPGNGDGRWFFRDEAVRRRLLLRGGILGQPRHCQGPGQQQGWEDAETRHAWASSSRLPHFPSSWISRLSSSCRLECWQVSKYSTSCANPPHEPAPPE